MDDLKYIMQRVIWIAKDFKDDDTYAELVDWVKRMEYDLSDLQIEDFETDKERDEWFLNQLTEHLRKQV